MRILTVDLHARLELAAITPNLAGIDWRLDGESAELSREPARRPISYQR
jgi:hypothetical protein